MIKAEFNESMAMASLPADILWLGTPGPGEAAVQGLYGTLTKLEEEGFVVGYLPTLRSEQRKDEAAARWESARPRLGFIAVLDYPSEAFQRLPNATYQIGFVRDGASQRDAESVSRCNAMDEIWVPSEDDARSLREQGLRPSIPVQVFPDEEGFPLAIRERLACVAAACAERAPRVLYRPDAPPWPLDGARAAVFLYTPDWTGEGWRLVLDGYISAFDAQAPTTLVLAIDPDGTTPIEQAIGCLEGALHAWKGRDLPDLLVLADRMSDADRGRLYAAVGAVIPGADGLSAARASLAGKHILVDLAPHAWRAMAERLLQPPEPSVPRSTARQVRRVAWEGTFEGAKSLALVNRALVDALNHSGRVRCLEGSPARALGEVDAVVRHQYPPDFRPAPGKPLVLMQPWEFGGLPRSWQKGLNRADQVWVYTEWLKSTYIASGVSPERIRVVPLGVDAACYTPEGRSHPLSTAKRFKFLFVGGLINRKGIDLLLQAYRLAFRREDDVCLVIKGFGERDVYASTSLHAYLETWLSEYRNGADLPEIEYLSGEWLLEDVAALFRACDVLVHPYRGEGFGLPMLEAMASGLPVIATDYGACLDFCDETTGWLLPANLQAAIPRAEDEPSTIGYWLAEPDRGALVAALRQAYADEPGRLLRGARARQRAVAWSWERAARCAEAALDELPLVAEP